MEETKVTKETTIEKQSTKRHKQKSKKTATKMSGLKSALVINNHEMLLTSFGKGNNAIAEKRYILDGDIETINNKNKKFDANNDSKVVVIKGISNPNGQLTNPLFDQSPTAIQPNRTSGNDMIGIRRMLERKYFVHNEENKEFQDNIRIQIAYCILDIEKILMPHINNICFEINNMLRLEGYQEDSFMGSFNLYKPYDAFIATTDDKESSRRDNFAKLMTSKQVRYLGNALYSDSLSNLTKDEILDGKRSKELKKYYQELCLLGMVRQSMIHSNQFNSSIYTLDSSYDSTMNTAELLGKGDDSSLVALATDARVEARAILDEIYKKGVDSINNSFLSNSINDLENLFKIYKCDSSEKKTELIKQYYDFCIRKPQMNMGFSITTIREGMFTRCSEANTLLLCDEGSTVKLNVHDTMKSKFYKNLDFMIYKYYKYENPEKGEKLIEDLRSKIKGKKKEDEDKKQRYAEESACILKAKRDIIKKDLTEAANKDLFADLVKSNKNEKQKFKNEYEELLKPFMIPVKVDYFSELIYLVTRFLSGKEINDLLTQLINKFENIAAFIRMYQNDQGKLEFTANYKMFEIDPQKDIPKDGKRVLSGSAKIAYYLRTINYIARMESFEIKSDKTAINDAISLLGYNSNEHRDEFITYTMAKHVVDKYQNTDYQKIVKDFLSANKTLDCKSKNMQAFVSELKNAHLSENYEQREKEIYELADTNLPAYFSEEDKEKLARYIVHSDGTYKKFLKESFYAIEELPNEGFRNFISNNVINSRRFNYIMRFCNPEKIANIGKNKVLISFALSSLAEKTDMIAKYYRVFCDRIDDQKTMEDYLVNKLTKISYTEFLNVNQKANAEKNKEKDRSQKLIGLYITLLYEIVKNLVNINSRYNIAFQRCDNDSIMILQGQYDERAVQESKLTKKFISNQKLNSYSCRYLTHNISQLDRCNDFIRQYRNKVAHLEVVSNIDEYLSGIKHIESYYALYHYLMQKCLLKNYRIEDHSQNEYKNLNDFSSKLDKHGTYVKDFVKALNVPFGYNLPRYKNLSIDELFDRNKLKTGGTIEMKGE